MAKQKTDPKTRPATAPAPARAAKPADTSALYIADMQDLLPYAHDGQSSPLPWGKFRTPAPLGNRSGSGPKSRHDLYSMRRSAIKARRDGFGMLAVYDEMIIFYGLARRAALRGWLVNHLYRAATAGQIASVISCADVTLVRRALTALEAEGLLVRVERPDLADADRKDITTFPAGMWEPPPGDLASSIPVSGNDIPTADGSAATDVSATPTAGRGPVGPNRYEGTFNEQNPNSPVGNFDSSNNSTRRSTSTADGAGQTPPHWTVSNGNVGTALRPADALPAASETANRVGCDGEPTECELESTLAEQEPNSPVGNQLAAKVSARDPVNIGDSDDPIRMPTGCQPCDVRRETGDGRRQTADRLRQTGDKEKETASAAPRPADGQTLDVVTPDGPPGADRRPTGHARHAGDAQAPDAATGRPPASDGRQTACPPHPADAEPDEPTEADRDPAIDQTWHAEAFARQVFDALYRTREEIVDQGRKAKGGQEPAEFTAREIGCFRGAFDKGLAGIGQVEATRLLQWSLSEAAESHRRKVRETRGCWWRLRFGQHITAERRRRAEAKGTP